MARSSKVPPHEEMLPYWLAYKESGDVAARQKLIMAYEPLVHYVSSRVKTGLPANVEQQDLHSYGLFGLLDAIEKYDLERNIKFQTYAISRIRGAIIDELRAIDWIPRSVRSRAREIDKATSQLESELNRTPTIEEVAERMEIEVEELRSSYTQMNSTTLVALDELVSSSTESQPLIDTLSDNGREDPEGSSIADEIKYLMARAIRRLDQKEYVVLSLYYVEGLTLSKIGEVLGVTESRVCQLHSASLLQLRQRLSEAL